MNLTILTAALCGALFGALVPACNFSSPTTGESADASAITAHDAPPVTIDAPPLLRDAAAVGSGSGSGSGGGPGSGSGGGPGSGSGGGPGSGSGSGGGPGSGSGSGATLACLKQVYDTCIAAGGTPKACGQLAYKTCF